MRSHERLPRIVTRGDAGALGISRRGVDHRVESGRWRRLLPRTYLTADACTPGDRLDAALAFAGKDGALSGAAALRESEVRGVAIPRRVLVLFPRLDSYGFVRIRRTSRPIELEHWTGRRRVVPARAAADHALELQYIVDDVRALVARVVGDGHASLPDLEAELAAGPRRGSAHLRRALVEVGAGAASAPEARAAGILRRADVPPFEQNVEICLPSGGYCVADFLWRDLRAVLEIDSLEYHLGPREWRRTMDRHLDLTTLNYSVVHRPPSALHDELRFAAEIRDWLTAIARRS